MLVVSRGEDNFTYGSATADGNKYNHWKSTMEKNYKYDLECQNYSAIPLEYDIDWSPDY